MCFSIMDQLYIQGNDKNTELIGKLQAIEGKVYTTNGNIKAKSGMLETTAINIFLACFISSMHFRMKTKAYQCFIYNRA